MSVQMVKRSEGRNSVAMSAYRAGQRLVDEATNLVKDYTAKTGVFLTEILTPKNAPSWMQDRERLWNGVEKKENRKDAQLAREINIALPTELNHFQKRELTTKYVQENFIDVGMVADVAYHNLETENPHCHVMLTTRIVDEAGFGKKERSWNSKDLLKKWRESWSNHANFALEKAGFAERIDHRTLEAQGIYREPQIHVGPPSNAEEPSIRTLKNEAIIARNAERELLKNKIKELQGDLNDERVLERSRVAKNHQHTDNRGLCLSKLQKRTLVGKSLDSSKQLSTLALLSDIKRDDRQQSAPVQQPNKRVAKHQEDKPFLKRISNSIKNLFKPGDETSRVQEIDSKYADVLVQPPKSVFAEEGVVNKSLTKVSNTVQQYSCVETKELVNELKEKKHRDLAKASHVVRKYSLAITDDFVSEYRNFMMAITKTKSASEAQAKDLARRQQLDIYLRKNGTNMIIAYHQASVILEEEPAISIAEEEVETIVESLIDAYYETYICDDYEHAKRLILDELKGLKYYEKLERLEQLTQECDKNCSPGIC